MNFLQKQLLLSIVLFAALPQGLCAMDLIEFEKKSEPQESGLISSVSSTVSNALFSKKGLFLSGISALGLGWWGSSDEQKQSVANVKNQALQLALTHKLPVAACTLGTVLIGTLGYKYFNMPCDKSTLKAELSVDKEISKKSGSINSDDSSKEDSSELPVFFQKFLGLLQGLYGDKMENPSESEAQRIEALCTMCSRDPQSLLLDKDFMRDIFESGLQVKVLLAEIITELYGGNLDELFLDGDFVEAFSKNKDDETKNLCYLFLAEALPAAHSLVLNQEYMQILQKNPQAPHVFYNFLVALSAVRHVSYLQDFGTLLEDGQELLQKRLTETGTIGVFIQEESLMNLLTEAQLEWMMSCIEQLNGLKALEAAFLETL
ncbi:hypothetical protein H0X06_06895 [Candidatus Dependentiae bacterium]|nr:hypothetical protein [Candidatus Dependentiae bacterium]